MPTPGGEMRAVGGDHAARHRPIARKRLAAGQVDPAATQAGDVEGCPAVDADRGRAGNVVIGKRPHQFHRAGAMVVEPL